MEAIIVAPKKRERRVSASLIKEVLDGQPIYYKGYRSVMYGHKNLEEIMGASSLEGLVILLHSKIIE